MRQRSAIYDGKSVRRFGLRKLQVLGTLSSLACGLFQIGTAGAETILLEGGGKLKGSIIEATDNIVTVRRSGGGVQQIVRKKIAEIDIELEDGQTIRGEFAGWANGVHHLRTEDGPVRVRAGRILDGGETETSPDEADDGEIAYTNRSDTRTYVPPPIYVFKNGATVVGRAIDYQDPLLIVRRATGGQQTLRVSDLQEVVIRDSDGDVLAGEFVNWSEGLFELRVSERLVQVSEGVVVNEAADRVEIGGPLEKVPQAPDPASRSVANQSLNAEAGGGMNQASTDEERVAISVSAEPASEQDEAAVFVVTLSRPAPRGLAIIYTALEDTADKSDFVNGSGVVIVKAGTDSAKIEIPLVDDLVEEGDESFRLFLTSDPNAVEITSNRISTVIHDND